MADATVTKKVLTSAFKKLVSEVPFSKISVGDICVECNLNRKSFYYHFKDKYDLANTYFDMDFPYFMLSSGNRNFHEVLYKLCEYFYTNRTYYKKMFEIDGQNSFSEHLRQEIYDYFLSAHYYTDEFSNGFWTDAVFYSVKDWITSRNCNHYDHFYRQLISCIRIDNQIS